MSAVDSRVIKVTVEGAQGSGKTTLLETLRKAGWRFVEEESDTGSKVTAKVMPPWTVDPDCWERRYRRW